MNKHTIAILGGGGRTGKYLLDQLTEQGFAVKLLLRNPALFEYKHHGIEIVMGDALDSSAVDALVKGCDAVVSLIGQRRNEPLVSVASTRLLIESMRRYSIDRYIAVVGLSVDIPGDRKGMRTKMASLMMRWLFSVVVADKQAAYNVLAKSSLKWTLVRVPYIVFTDLRSKIDVSLEDCPGRKINSSNIAAFIVAQLSDTTYYRKAPFIANG